MRHKYHGHKDFNCLNLQKCKSNIDISIFYLFIYSNSIKTIYISNIWFTYLQFYTVKIFVRVTGNQLNTLIMILHMLLLPLFTYLHTCKD